MFLAFAHVISIYIVKKTINNEYGDSQDFVPGGARTRFQLLCCERRQSKVQVNKKNEASTASGFITIFSLKVRVTAIALPTLAREDLKSNAGVLSVTSHPLFCEAAPST